MDMRDLQLYIAIGLPTIAVLASLTGKVYELMGQSPDGFDCLNPKRLTIR